MAQPSASEAQRTAVPSGGERLDAQASDRRGPARHGAQVLHIGDHAGRLRLLAAAGGRVVDLPLEGTFSWTLSEERTCTGRVEDLRHAPCPTDERVTLHSQCGPCSGLESQDCVFEPLCKVNNVPCTCTFGPIPHVVYLAFHGVLPKVGMTQAWRLERRLREQGADAGFVVAQLDDRAAARRLEQAIAFTHGVPEYRTHNETLPQLARPVPWAQLEERAEAWRRRLSGAHAGHSPGELVRVADHLLPQPLDGRPVRVASGGRHAGTWVGLKGPHLVYRAKPMLDVGLGGPLHVLKRGDLAGRWLNVGDAPRPA